jgi:hypothetical protein
MAAWFVTVVPAMSRSRPTNRTARLAPRPRVTARCSAGPSWPPDRPAPDLASGSPPDQVAAPRRRGSALDRRRCNEWANFTETGQPPLDRIDAFLARGIQTEP